ncbi:MAG: 2OG-Fe(II) oxygenase [Luteimonas sp.]|nr:2OG-Fe(II) oxygenase [Luteimonas sp.]
MNARFADRTSVPDAVGIVERIDGFDWDGIAAGLGARGNALLPGLLSRTECDELVALYDDDARHRSRVLMARHGFGRGEYRYFRYPLPDRVQALRTALYPRLVPVANRWNRAMKLDVQYPNAHADFVERCHAAGQLRPTPLLLRYGEGDYNCLHQDLYGEHVFPLQVAVLLSQPGRGPDGGDFEGGEFVLTEQRPRMQSRAEVVPLQQGDAVVFAVHQRPVQGARGSYRVNVRHGVSRLRRGHRHTLGVIFHDAA